jgi:hypothetical protein
MVSSSSYRIFTPQGDLHEPRDGQDGRPARGLGFHMMIKLALLIAIYCVLMLFPRMFSRATAQEAEGA